VVSTKRENLTFHIGGSHALSKILYKEASEGVSVDLGFAYGSGTVDIQKEHTIPGG